MLRVGVDVGGTNTDAVVLQGCTVLGTAKHTTSSDLLVGISKAVQAALTAANTGS